MTKLTKLLSFILMWQARLYLRWYLSSQRDSIEYHAKLLDNHVDYLQSGRGHQDDTAQSVGLRRLDHEMALQRSVDELLMSTLHSFSGQILL